MNSPHRPQHLTQAALKTFAEPLIREVIQRLLTRRHVDRDDVSLSKALRRPGSLAHQRLMATNVVGIGFGIKETKDQLLGDLAIRVYVTKKIPNSQLTRKYQVPSQVNGHPTDVVRVGRLKHHARPVALGASISRASGLTGSLGCIVSLPNDSNWYVLSAAHVLAPEGTAQIGDEVVEPSATLGGASSFAKLADFEPLRSDAFKNTMDAALAQLLHKSDVTVTLPEIGDVKAEVMEPTVFQSVRTFGAGSARATLGVVTDVIPQVKIDSPSIGDSYLYSQVFEVTGCGGNFSTGGDSGALIVDALSNRPVGLVIGGGPLHTFATPIGRVLTRFQATIVES